MRLYTRKNFLELSEGVIFAKGPSDCLLPSGFCVKAETLRNDEGLATDFVYLDLVDIESFDSNEHWDRCVEMLETDKSYPIATSFGRDGSFDDTEVFLVFEPHDLEVIQDIINEHLQKHSQD